MDAVIYPTGNTSTFLPDYEEFSERSLLQHAQRRLPSVALRPGDIILQKLRVNYGMKDENPLKYLHFFHSGEPDVKTKLSNEQVEFSFVFFCFLFIFLSDFFIKVGQIQPSIFEEKLVRLFVRDKSISFSFLSPPSLFLFSLLLSPKTKSQRHKNYGPTTSKTLPLNSRKRRQRRRRSERDHKTRITFYFNNWEECHQSVIAPPPLRSCSLSIFSERERHTAWR